MCLQSGACPCERRCCDVVGGCQCVAIQLQKYYECFLTHCYVVARLFWGIPLAQVKRVHSQFLYYYFIFLHLRPKVELRMFLSLIDIFESECFQNYLLRILERVKKRGIRQKNLSEL